MSSSSSLSRSAVSAPTATTANAVAVPPTASLPCLDNWRVVIDHREYVRAPGERFPRECRGERRCRPRALPRWGEWNDAEAEAEGTGNDASKAKVVTPDLKVKQDRYTAWLRGNLCERGAYLLEDVGVSFADVVDVDVEVHQHHSTRLLRAIERLNTTFAHWHREHRGAGDENE